MYILKQRKNQHGVSLVELIMFIVIVSVALAGILLVMNQTTRGSADPLLRKQAIAAAHSLLEEVQLQDFSPASGAGVPVKVTQANRASTYHLVSDYDGFATSGIFSLTDAASASAVLPNYNVNVAITPQGVWNGIAAGSAVQIDVTVTAPQGLTVTATGYRTAY
ncbi:MAG: type II secretion system protein [Gallionella sp.]|nr:type II secretion system protein [Gallionella sp.]